MHGGLLCEKDKYTPFIEVFHFGSFPENLPSYLQCATSELRTSDAPSLIMVGITQHNSVLEFQNKTNHITTIEYVQPACNNDCNRSFPFHSDRAVVHNVSNSGSKQLKRRRMESSFLAVPCFDERSVSCIFVTV